MSSEEIVKNLENTLKTEINYLNNDIKKINTSIEKQNETLNDIKELLTNQMKSDLSTIKSSSHKKKHLSSRRRTAPSVWTEYTDFGQSGQSYWVNSRTGVSRWTNPTEKKSYDDIF